MEIEQAVFSTYRVVKEKLLSYGFTFSSGSFTYFKGFMDGEFEAAIRVDETGAVSGQVIEKAFGEEFAPLRVKSFAGGYVGTVREAYREILIDIRDHCFEKETFISNQANRLKKLIEERYHEAPDFPFEGERFENYGVFRYHGNQKWYGLIMNVDRGVFGGSKEEEFVDILNVRIDEEKREEILKIKGIYPSYHMNKQKWVSILLNESLRDEEIMEFIDSSRNFMIGKTARKGNERLYFLQPCNPKTYDLEAAFIRDNGITGWKQSRKVNIGDICYMYIANPVGAVKFKCEVVETDIPFEYQSKELSIAKLMKIKLLKTIEHDDIDFAFLRSIGVALIRGPVSISEEMAKKIEEKID